ncbi:MAG: type II secretion system minor pseudopilin GspK [Pseudomonadota bacterium]
MDRLRRAGRQRGVAVITALLLTALAITIVASLFWQQQVQVRSMENQRLHLQTKWILRGALDWVRLILHQDGIDNQRATAENGVWATPLAETRLDDYVERERVATEKYDATLSGQITDAQGRYNLGNLAKQRQVKQGELTVFRRLLENLQLNPSLAQAVADQVASGQKVTPAAGGGASSGTGGGIVASATGSTSGAAGGGTSSGAIASTSSGGEPMEIVRVEDLLAVAGFTQQAVERLRDFVIVLPEDGVTAVNVNTAPAELLAALVQNYSVSEASALVLARKRTPFDQGTFTSALNNRPMVPDISIDMKSSYFLVQSRIRLDRAALDAEALIKRDPANAYKTTLVWVREN